MRYSVDEYEDSIIQLNLNKSKKIIKIATIVTIILTFIITSIIKWDPYFNSILSIFAAIAVFYSLRKIIKDSTKRINFTKDIAAIEQDFDNDKIVEKVIRKDNVETNGEYYYKDIAFVKEDKSNYYLYLNNKSAIIVIKRKFENIEQFKKILIDNKLID